MEKSEEIFKDPLKVAKLNNNLNIKSGNTNL